MAVLKGSFMFAADLLRALHRVGLAPQVEFVHLSSYRTGTVSSGQVEILRDVESEVRGRDVLLVDDILESGRTVVFAKDLLMARGARRVLIAVLLEKPGKRAVTVEADFVGFICPDVFVVGYGMDVAHAFRQLPFVGVVDYGSGDPDLSTRSGEGTSHVPPWRSMTSTRSVDDRHEPEPARASLRDVQDPARILLVDDEEHVRGFLKRGLEIDGTRRHATTAATARPRTRRMAASTSCSPTSACR